MFILYAVPIGLIVGALLGGRVARLGDLRFEWKAVVFAGLLVQIVIFSDPVAARIGDLGPILYVGSTAVVLAAVLRNHAVRGLRIVALGAASNLAAIVANGGYMPAGGGARAALGKSEPTAYSNSTYIEHPVLEPLTDLFAMPPWMPFANIFSVGDVLIGAGVAWAIVAAMQPAPLAGAGDSAGGARPHLVPPPPPRGTDGSLDATEARRTLPDEGQAAPSLELRPGQTRREAATQSQGSSDHEDRPAAGKASEAFEAQRSHS